MALSDYISQRIYDAFRIDGVAQNKQSPEVITIATTVDDSTPIEVNVQQPVSIDDNGGSITVDGDVNASLFDEAGNPFTTSNTLPISGPVVLQDPNDPTRQGEFDNLFHAPLIVDIAHHEVHEGDMYSTNLYDEDAANNHVVNIFILTPATATPQKHMHMITQHSGSGEHYYSITEGCTYSSSGVAVTPTNRHRGSVKTSSVQSAYSGSTKGSNAVVVTGGTVIWDDWTGAGKSIGGEGRSLEEWILAPNTGYLYQIQSKAAGIQIDLEAIWYEHTDE